MGAIISVCYKSLRMSYSVS